MRRDRGKAKARKKRLGETMRGPQWFIGPSGTVCITGLLSGQWTLDSLDPIVNANGGCLTGFYSDDVDSKKLQALISTIEDRQIDMKPKRTFHLSETRQTHAYLASRDSLGRAVAIPELDE